MLKFTFSDITLGEFHNFVAVFNSFVGLKFWYKHHSVSLAVFSFKIVHAASTCRMYYHLLKLASILDKYCVDYISGAFLKHSKILASFKL